MVEILVVGVQLYVGMLELVLVGKVVGRRRPMKFSC